jgi:hypothetical protein
VVLTVYAVQTVQVDEVSGGGGKGFSFDGVGCYLSKVFAAFAIAANGEDDLEMREALLERSTGTQTAVCTVDFNLVVCPIVA